MSSVPPVSLPFGGSSPRPTVEIRWGSTIYDPELRLWWQSIPFQAREPGLVQLMCQSPAIPAKGECTVSIHHSGCQFPYLGPSALLWSMNLASWLLHRGKMAKLVREPGMGMAPLRLHGEIIAQKKSPSNAVLLGLWLFLIWSVCCPANRKGPFFSSFFIFVLSLTEKILNRGNSCIPDFVSTVSFILICLAWFLFSLPLPPRLHMFLFSDTISYV